MVVLMSYVSEGGAGNLGDNPRYDLEDIDIIRSQPGVIALQQIDIQMEDNWGSTSMMIDMTGIIGVDAEGPMKNNEHLVAIPCPPQCPDKSEQQGNNMNLMSFDTISENNSNINSEQNDEIDPPDLPTIC